MKEKILRAIQQCLIENGFVDIKLLSTAMGVDENMTEIIATVKIRAEKRVSPASK